MEPLNLQHANVKLFLEGDGNIDFPRVVETFHRWVSGQAVPGVLLVDVADYRHVPSGPGILLVGLEADFNLDHTGGRWGLRYNRKAELSGSNEERLREALRAAARAGLRIESEVPGVRFLRNELEIFYNDRALAPNSDETWEAVRPVVGSVLEEAFGHGAFAIGREGDPRKRFGVSVTAERPFVLEMLAGADVGSGRAGA
jgi:hypothetical protein